MAAGTTAAVIVAAGRGERAGGGLPKQWRMLGDRTVAARTLAAFRAAPRVGPIILVLHPDDMGLAAGYEAHADVEVVAGGATRSGIEMTSTSVRSKPAERISVAQFRQGLRQIGPDLEGLPWPLLNMAA